MICGINDDKTVTWGGDGIGYEQREEKCFKTFGLEGGEGKGCDGDNANDFCSCDSDRDKSQLEECGTTGNGGDDRLGSCSDTDYQVQGSESVSGGDIWGAPDTAPWLKDINRQFVFGEAVEGRHL